MNSSAARAWQAFDDKADVQSEAAYETVAPSSEPMAVPASAPAPFAPLPAAGAVWPLRSSHSKRHVVSYRATDNSIVGNKSRRFMARRRRGTRYHVGIDLYAELGDPVVACENGIITNFHPFLGDTKALVVEHGRLAINYGEVATDSLRRTGLRVGAPVHAGQIIGYVGLLPGGSHMLHFETYTSGTRSNQRWYKGKSRPSRILNPTKYLLALTAGSNGPAGPSAAGRVGRLSDRISNALRKGMWGVALTLSVLGGQTDENKLTNMIFFARHPELNGRRIARHEKNLAAEWRSIRDQLVRPFLRQQAASATSNAQLKAPVVARPVPSGPARHAPATRISSTTLGRIRRYDALIDRVSDEENFDKNWVRGVIAAESNGNARAGRKRGYKGLMQASRHSNQYDPETSIRTGIRKLKRFRRSVKNQYQKYGIDTMSLTEEEWIRVTMVAFNAGPGTLARAMRYAAEGGDARLWMQPENFVRSLIYYGSYSIPTAIKHCLQGPNQQQIVEEFAALLNISAVTLRGRYHSGSRWNHRKVARDVRAATRREKQRWKKSSRSYADLQLNAPVWLRCAAEFKHRNLREWYLDKIISYWKHFRSA